MMRAVLLMSLFLLSVDGGLTPDQIRTIDSVVESVMKCRQIPGLTLAVVSKDEILYTKGYGYSDVQAGKKVTTKTLFPIGSTTKAFTSTVLAHIMAKSKRFNMDTPIKKILGSEFKLYNSQLTDHVTLTDLLSHRTGLEDNFIFFTAGYPKNMTRRELVRRFRYYVPRWPLREKFVYNNHMYFLAAMVGEEVSSLTWEQMVRHFLFKPLGMTSSTFIGNSSGGDVAMPYTVESDRPVRVSPNLREMVLPAGPAGGIMSSADDMAKWLQFHLRNGRNQNGDQIVPRSVLEETYVPEMHSGMSMSKRDIWRPAYPVSDTLSSYDLGWMTSVYRGYRRLWHSGFIVTYKTQLWLYPDVGVGLYLTTNGPATEAISMANVLLARHVSDVILGENTWLDNNTVCSFPYPWVNSTDTNEDDTPQRLADDTPPRPLADYLGSFFNPMFGPIIIRLTGTANKLNFEMGRFMKGKLLYDIRQQTYHLRLQGPLAWSTNAIPISFNSSTPDGVVDELNIPLNGDPRRTTRFVRKENLKEYVWTETGGCTSYVIHNGSNVYRNILSTYGSVILSVLILLFSL